MHHVRVAMIAVSVQDCFSLGSGLSCQRFFGVRNPSLMDAPRTFSVDIDAKQKLVQELEFQLDNTNRKLKVTRKEKGRKKPSAYMEKVAQSLVAQSGGTLEHAEAYLQTQRASAHREWTLEDWKRCLRDWWNAASWDMKERLTVHPVTKTERVACNRATQFLRELHLHNWVANRNFEQQLAPSAAAMLRVSKVESEGAVAKFLRGSKNKKVPWTD